MTQPRTLAASLLLLIVALLGASGQAHAQSLVGTYNPSSQRIDVQVITWGEDCGPRPQSHVLQPQGPVSVKEDGAHLVMRFSDRTLKTNGCWSPNPAVKLVSATSANGRFRAECKTAPGDAKREIGRYTASAAAGIVELLEESDYDWQLKQSHCVAKLRMTQTLTSTRLPAPVEPVAPVGPVAHVVDAATPAATPCVPGAPVRLRLRPADARVAPGERVCFSPRALDAAGCSVDLADDAVSYTLLRPNGVQGTLSGSCFKAAANTALAEGLFKIVASSASLRAEASITVSAPDLSDITARRGPSSGPLGSQERAEETALESGIRAVASSSHGTLWLGLTIAGLAVLLSLVAIGALRLARRQLSDPPPPGQDSTAHADFAGRLPTPIPIPGAAPVPVPVVTGPQRICPRCRRGYPPGSERCQTDGEALLDYDVFAKQSAPRGVVRHCPECGERLTSDSVFCGRCGAKLGG